MNRDEVLYYDAWAHDWVGRDEYLRRLRWVYAPNARRLAYRARRMWTMLTRRVLLPDADHFYLRADLVESG